MKIFSVTDPEFKPYGCVVTGLDTAKAEILAALANTPLPAATDYVAEDAGPPGTARRRRSVGSIFSAACPANWAGATVTTPI